MSDELDRELMEIFSAAHAADAASDASFIAQAEQRLQQARGVRRVMRWSAALLLLALVTALAPYVIEASVGLSDRFAGFLRDPWGWVVSIALGAWIVLRARSGVRLR